jgi:hypothetical protein
MLEVVPYQLLQSEFNAPLLLPNVSTLRLETLADHESKLSTLLQPPHSPFNALMLLAVTSLFKELQTHDQSLPLITVDM